MRQWILDADRLVGRAVLAMACMALAVAALAGLFQIITRFLLEQPSDWTEVLTRTAIIWSVYLGLSAALRGGALLSVDLAYRMASRTPYLRLLQAMITACTLAFLVLVVWFGWDVVHRVRFQNLAGLEISISWAYAAVPIGAAFGILGVIANFLDPKRGELETQQ